MSGMDTASSSGAPEAMAPKDSKVQSKAPTSKEPRKPHPAYSKMIIAALKAQEGPKGMSRKAIVKYIQDNFELTRRYPVIYRGVKRALKKELAKGTIKATRGKGVTGSFKAETPKKAGKVPVKKAATPTTPGEKVATPTTLGKKAATPTTLFKKAARVPVKKATTLTTPGKKAATPTTSGKKAARVPVKKATTLTTPGKKAATPTAPGKKAAKSKIPVEDSARAKKAVRPKTPAKTSTPKEAVTKKTATKKTVKT